MGYESRVIVVDVKRYGEENGHPAWVYGEEIAAIKMSCMGGKFPELFTREIDYEIAVPHEDKLTQVDCYGEHIKAASIKEIVEWLEKEILVSDYRRLKPPLSLLKGFDEAEWECLEVLHYGY